MKIEIILIFQITLMFFVTKAKSNDDIFTDYCKPGLCDDSGGAHSGCKDGIRHDGKFQSPPCFEDASIIPLTRDDKQSILDYHNEQRNFVACGGLYRQYRLGPGCRIGLMTWDIELEKTAFLHVSYCLSDHDHCRSTVKYPHSGQNTALLPFSVKPEVTEYYITVIPYIWYIGYRSAKMSMIDSFYQQSEVMVDDFLTTMNERNNRVGCAFARFFDTKKKRLAVMLTCNYPVKNLNGSAVYNSCKTPASKCTKGIDPRYRFLCSWREKYDVSGILKHIPYDGSGKESYACGDNIEFDHFDKKSAESIKLLHKLVYPNYPIPVEKVREQTTKMPAVTTTRKHAITTTQKHSAKTEDVFTDYCKPGLCTVTAGESAHSGCIDGDPHDGNFQSPPCSEDAALIPLTDEEKQSILDYHNEHRNFVACGGLYKEHRLGPGCRHGVVTWDKELEKTAFLHSSYCLLDHDKCRSTLKYPFSGQNVGLLTFHNRPHNTSYYINTITYFWYVEYLHTKMDMINSFHNQSEWIVDHFLTSINERNNRVGCTFARFFDDKTEERNVVMLTCNYPTSNIEGTAIYNSCKKPASKCTTGTDPKYKYLCSSKEYYAVSGLLKHIPYDGDGTEVFDCGKEPELYHYDREGAEDIKKLRKTKYPDKPIPGETPSAETDKDVFTDYCKPGLCTDTGDGSAHSGCKDGVSHDGNFQSPPCPGNAALIPLTDAEKQSILDYHNEHRNFIACGGLYKEYRLEPGCRHGVVTWDNELEKTAFLHSSYCLRDHDKCRSTVKYPFSGQNIGVLTFNNEPHNTSYYINTITYFWYVEYLHTKMDMINSFHNQSKWIVDHFLTSINERNNRVGCTFARFFDDKTEKKNVVMLTCNYPTSNIEGTAIYNSCKKPASKCTTGTDPKYKYLCSSKEHYDVSGLLKHIPYDGDGTEVFDCGKEPELYHYDREGAEDIKKLRKTKYPDKTIPGEITPAKIEEDIFTDYCKPGLCTYAGGDNAHSGCTDGVPHNGNFQSPPCPEDAALIQLTDADKQSILDHHNEHRNFVACGGLYKEYHLGPGCRHGVVTWDKELEKTAFLHTSYCLSDQDKCRNTIKYPFSGQNIGLLTFDNEPHNTSYYITTFTYYWYFEYLHTDMNMINSYMRQTTWIVDHFLIIINERNNRVGCSFGRFFDNKMQQNIVMLTCNYPTTNIEGSTIYNSCKEPASKCSTGTDSKFKFLCSSKEQYDHRSDLLKHIPYDGDGTEEFNCGKNADFSHYNREGDEDIKEVYKPVPSVKPEEQISKEVAVTTTKTPEEQISKEVAITTTKTPEEATSKEVAITTTKTPEEQTSKEVAVTTTKTPEEQIPKEVAVTTTKTPEEEFSNEVAVITTKTPEEQTSKEVAGTTTKTPEEQTSREVSVTTTKTPEEQSSNKVAVTTTKTPEEEISKEVAVTTTKTPEEAISNEVAVKSTKTPEEQTSKEVAVVATEKPEEKISMEVAVTTTKTPEEQISKEVAVTTTKTPEEQISNEVAVTTTKTPEEEISKEVAVTTTKTPEEQTSKEVAVVATEKPEEKISMEVAVTTTKTPEEQISKEVAVTTTKTSEEQISKEVAVTTTKTPEEEFSNEVAVTTTKTPEEQTSKEVAGTTTKTPEEQTSREVSVTTTKTPEEQSSNKVAVTTTKTPEEEISKEVAVTTTKTPEEAISNEVAVKSTKTPEEQTLKEVAGTTTKTTEEQTSKEVAVTTTKTPEEQISKEVAVTTTKTSEEQTSKKVAVTTTKTPEEQISKEVAVTTTKTSEEQISKEVAVTTTKTPEEEFSNEVAVTTTKTPEEQTSKEVAGTTTKTPEEQTSREVSVTTTKTPEEQSSNKVAVTTTKTPEEEISKEVAVTTTKTPEEAISNEVAVKSTKTPEEQTSKEVAVVATEKPEEKISMEVAVTTTKTPEEQTSKEVAGTTTKTTEEQTSKEVAVKTTKTPEEQISKEVAVTTTKTPEEQISKEVAIATTKTPEEATSKEVSVTTTKTPEEQTSKKVAVTTTKTPEEQTSKEVAVTTTKTPEEKTSKEVAVAATKTPEEHISMEVTVTTTKTPKEQPSKEGAVTTTKTPEEQISMEVAVTTTKTPEEQTSKEVAVTTTKTPEEEFSNEVAVTTTKTPEEQTSKEVAVTTTKTPEEQTSKEVAVTTTKIPEEKTSKEVAVAATKTPEEQISMEFAVTTTKTPEEQPSKEGAVTTTKTPEEQTSKEVAVTTTNTLEEQTSKEVAGTTTKTPEEQTLKEDAVTTTKTPEVQTSKEVAGTTTKTPEEQISMEVAVTTTKTPEEQTSKEVAVTTTKTPKEQTSKEVAVTTTNTLEEQTSKEVAGTTTKTPEEQTLKEDAVTTTKTPEVQTSKEVAGTTTKTPEEQTLKEVAVTTTKTPEVQTSKEVAVATTKTPEEQTSKEVAVTTTKTVEEQTSKEDAVTTTKTPEEQTSKEVAVTTTKTVEEQTSKEVAGTTSKTPEEQTSKELAVTTTKTVAEQISKEVAVATTVKPVEKTSNEVAVATTKTPEEQTSKEVAVTTTKTPEEQTSKEVAVTTTKTAEEQTSKEVAVTTTKTPEEQTSKEVAVTTTKTPEEQTSKEVAVTTTKTPEEKTSKEDAVTTTKTPEEQTSKEVAVTTTKTPEEKTSKEDAVKTTKTPEEQTSKEVAVTTTKTAEEQTSKEVAVTTTKTPEEKTSKEDAVTTTKTPEEQTSKEVAVTTTKTPEEQTSKEVAVTTTKTPEEQTSKEVAVTTTKTPEEQTSKEVAVTTTKKPEEQTSKEVAVTATKTPEEKTSKEDAVTTTKTPEETASKEVAVAPTEKPEEQTSNGVAVATTKTPEEQTSKEVAVTTTKKSEEQTSKEVAVTTTKTPEETTSKEVAVTTTKTTEKQTSKEVAGTTTKTPEEKTSKEDAGTTTKTPEEQTSKKVAVKTTKTPEEQTSKEVAVTTANKSEEKTSQEIAVKPTKKPEQTSKEVAVKPIKKAEQASKKVAETTAKKPEEQTTKKVAVTTEKPSVSTARTEKDIFTDYCKPGLCTHTGGDKAHSGCKNGVPHNGNFQSPPCPENAALIPLTDDDKQSILDYHNEHRNFVACGGLYKGYRIEPGCRHGVVTWDRELEKTAFLHTSYCLYDQDKCRNTVKYPFSGQNFGVLGFVTEPRNTSYYINAITYFWYVEYLRTKMDMITVFKRQTTWIVDHFLVLINERNNRVGCSFGRFFDVKNLRNVVMLTCNYPTTNIEGSTIYNSCKKPASKCTTGTDSKFKFLCSSKEQYDHRSDLLKHIPYDGDGSEEFDCGKKSEFYHYDREGAEDIKKLHKIKYPDKPIPGEKSIKQTTTKVSITTTKKPKEQTTKKNSLTTTKKPSVSTSITEKDIFTDYCKPGLCTYTGGDNAHSGCKNGVPHNGNFQSPPCPENAALITLTDADKQSILDYHNEHRNFVACGGLYKGYRIEPGCRHGVVTWDKELEKTAFLHTSYCLYDHDKCRNTVKYPFSGQNFGVLGFVTEPRNTSYYINAITYFWYVEYLRTKMDMITVFKRQTTWIVDHFLVLINERNSRVGCSFGRFFDVKKLRNVVMLTCNYPTTNIEGSTIYNSCKEPASKCTTGTDRKFKFLCSSKEQYDHRSDLLKHIPYDGDGSEEFDCGKKSEFYHYDREGAEDIKKLHKIKYPDKPIPGEKSKEQAARKAVLKNIGKASVSMARTEKDIFTDYCKPGLCTYTGGDKAHSGCKNGVPHNGNFQSPPCPENAALIPLTDAEKQSILDYHNEHRNFVACGGLYKGYSIEPGCRHGVVTWDRELEKTAFLHTSYCLYDQDKCRNTVKYPFSGQNFGVLGFVTKPRNTSYYINAITYFWYVEYLRTKMDMITVFKRQTTWMVDHFLVLINERNNRVGCSFGRFFDVKKLRNVVMLTCNYPTTNIEGSTIYNSCKKPASKCTTGTDRKFKFLCSSKEQYDHRSDLLKHIPYDGDGSEEFDCGKKSEFYHYDREGAEDIKKLHKIKYPDKPIPGEKSIKQTTTKVSITTTKKPKEQTTKKNSLTTTKKPSVSTDRTEKGIFTDYCKPGLCTYIGGDKAHSGCKNGVPHNGNFQSPPCPENAALIPLTDDDKQSILDYHNEHRNFVACGGLYKGYRIEPGCRHGVVTWDKELEKTAFLHTSYCLYDQDKCRNTVKYPFSGQNFGVLGFVTEPRNTSYYINAISYFWYVEYFRTKMDMITVFKRQTTWIVDHFLVLINERNNRVGCSFGRFFDVKKLRNVVMLTCNYPTTNIEGSTIYNSCKKPASKCTTGTDSKFKFLCSSKEQYDHRSDLLKHIPYDGDGSEEFDCGKKSEFYHYDREGAEDIKKLHKIKYPDKPIPGEKSKELTTKKVGVTTTNKPKEQTTKKIAITTAEKPSVSTASPKKDIFTDYCKPGLCTYTGGDNAHSGCKNGVPHNGNFQSPPCPENAALIPLTDEDKQSILDYHNEHRNFVACGGLYKGYRIEPGCRHGVVTWDKELEKTAFLHTSYCLYDQDKCRNTVKYPFSGQNFGVLGFVTEPRNTSYYINAITYFWYVEYFRTKMDMITVFKRQTTWMVDHFLVLINERNNRVGCSFGRFFDVKKLRNVVMLTCNYPTTNIEGSTIYNSCKEPASKCATGTDSKFKFLCSSKEQYDHRSDLLKHIPYDGDGSEEFDCGKKSEFYHYEREGAEDIKKLHKIKYPDKPIPGEKPKEQTTKKVPVATTKKPKEQTTKKNAITTTEKPSASPKKDIFTDYCKPGLCTYTGGDNAHSGCKDGVPHNGNFQSPPCPENAALIPLTDADKQSILDYHNEHRNFVACGGLYKGYRIEPGCRHGVVTWDKELEKTAFLHTSYCLYDQDKCRNTVKYPFSGQNFGVLGFVTEPRNTSYYINAITYFWYVEYFRTKMDMITVFKRQTTWMVDHFLVLINERNNRVGCSFGRFFDVKKLRNVVMLTCNYPTTNIEGSTIYNSCKEPASKCTTGTDSKFKFLCSSKEQYDHRSDLLKYIPYDGDGSEEFDCGKKSELYHYDREGAEDIKKLHKIKYPDKPIPGEKPKEQTTKKVDVTTTNKPKEQTKKTPGVTTTEKPLASPKKDIFTDYCKPGLCTYTGGDNAHSGCKDGVPHNGNFQSPPCPENAALIPLTDADKQSILDYHNEHRNFVACGGLYKGYRIEPGCRHGVVTWDKELEKTAFLHTSYCLYDQDKCRNTVKYPFSGQNFGVLGFVTEPRNTSYYINAITYFWYVEYFRTKMDMITVFKRQTTWMVDHFLVLINERNNRVGCSFGRFFDVKKLRNVVMLTCNYPTTNIEGSTIYNSCKEPASKCTTGTDSKFKFLCSSKEQYDHRSDLLKYIPYDGDGSEEFDCGKKSEFYHYDREGAEDIKKLHKIKYPDKPIPGEKPKEQTTKKVDVTTTNKPKEQTKKTPGVTTTEKSLVKTEEDIFTDYCKPGLCTYNGGDNAHSGCKEGVPHNGNFQSPPCPENAALIPLTDADKQSILDYHNEHRNFVACGGLYKGYSIEPGCRHGVVTWDKELEKTAFLHTSYCLYDQDKCRNTVKYPFSGQNFGVLGFVTEPRNTSYYINAVTYFWYVEYLHTKMDMITVFKRQTTWMVDHFLVLINERNNRVGCSFGRFFDVKKLRNVVMLTCNYPTTNIEGSTIYNGCKKPASECATGTDPKFKFLCSSKEQYDHRSDLLKHIPYDGDGTEEFNCGKKSEFYHYDREGAADIKKLHKVKYPDKPIPGEKPKEKTTKKGPVTTTKKPKEQTTKKNSITTTEKPSARTDEDIFTDYCKPGLCNYTGGDNTHSGCKDGFPHNGNFQSPPCPENAAIIPLTDGDKQSILDYHNEHRNFVACGGLYKEFRLGPGCRHGVVTWDNELEKAAFLHTSYCLYDEDKCHNTVKYPFSGQNVGVLGFVTEPRNTSYYINAITYFWYVEYLHTKMDMITVFKRQTTWMVDHFLVLINERNNRVGCSFGRFFDVKKLRNVVMLTCNYPTTNIEGSTIYNSCKKPASECATGTDPKFKFLCSSREQYDHRSDLLKHIPYDGDGTEEFNCGKKSEFYHYNREGAEDIKKLHKVKYSDKPIPREKPKEQTVNRLKYLKRNPEDDIFTDYCKSGLCTHFGGDGAHSGCKNGVLHDGKFQSPPCPEGAARIPLTDADKQSILHYHNMQRNFVACGGLYKKHRIGPGCRHGVVTWDKELEKTSFLHASYCLVDHDKCRSTLKYPFSGQNVGLITLKSKPYNNSYYINSITYLWYVEYVYATMGMIDSYNDKTKWTAGHFLTFINERNNRVGCSFVRFFDVKKKKNVAMLSCNYPTINVDKTAVYNSCKRPASKCRTGRNPKYRFLCSSKEKYDVSTMLKHIPYDGSGTEVFNCGRDAEFYNYGREEGDDIKQNHNAIHPDRLFPREVPAQKEIYFPDGNPARGGVPDNPRSDNDPRNQSLTKFPSTYMPFFFVFFLVTLYYF